MKKWINVILIATDWEFYHTKDYILSKGEVFKNWSDILVVQLPVSFLVHFFTNFKRKILGFLNGNYKPFKIHENITVFTPKILFHYLLWNKWRFTFLIDNIFFRYQLNSFIKKYYVGKRIIQWIFHPVFYILQEKLKYDVLIYDYQDNYNYDCDGKFLPEIAEINHKLESKSDIVFCTAKAMYNDAIQFNSRTYYLRNANNFELIYNYGNTAKNSLKQLDKRIIGYAGGIRDWLDFELIEYLLKNFADCYFVFIGLVYKTAIEQMKTLKKYPNFIYIEYMPLTELVGHMKQFDIGIIPFRINKFSEGIFPNKFFEYVAAEIPIVTTALIELEEFKDYIGYARTKEEFANSCRKILNGVFKDRIKHYRSIAEQNSWHDKAIKVNDIITGFIKENL